MSARRPTPLGLRVNSNSDVIHREDCHHVGEHFAWVAGIFKTDRPCSHCRPILPAR